MLRTVTLGERSDQEDACLTSFLNPTPSAGGSFNTQDLPLGARLGSKLCARGGERGQ